MICCFSLSLNRPDIGNSEPMETEEGSAEMSKHKEELLKENKEWLFHVVENANETIMVTQDGFIKYCNPKALDVSGYSLQELTSKPFIEFIHPDDRERVLHHCYQIG